jgi:DNA-binding MltR family transcriptional regulator
MKHLKHASETLTKTPKNTWNHCKNIHNIQIKHLQHMCETYATSKITHLQHTSRKQMKYWEQHSLQHTCTTIATYAISRSSFITST